MKKFLALLRYLNLFFFLFVNCIKFRLEIKIQHEVQDKMFGECLGLRAGS